MTIKVVCYMCGSPKFGLVRYYLRGKVFCKMSCRNNFTQGEARTPPPQFGATEEDRKFIKILQYP